MLSRAQRARVEARTASAVHRPIPRQDRVPRPARDEGRWDPPLHPCLIASLARKSCFPTNLRLSRAAARPCRSPHGRRPCPGPSLDTTASRGRLGMRDVGVRHATPPHCLPCVKIVFPNQPHAEPARSAPVSKHARRRPCTGPSLDTTASRGRLGMRDVGVRHSTPPHCLPCVKFVFPDQPHAERPEGPVEARTASAVHRPIPRHDRVPRPARDEGR